MLRTALSSTLRRAVTAAPRVAPRMAPQPALRWARPAEFSSAPALFDKYYTDTHEWVDVQGDVATIGITNYAQNSLGDVVYVELPDVDDELAVEDEFGVVESVKAASELIAPVSGKVVEVNEELTGTPSLINSSPEGDGWMIKIALEDSTELSKLLSAEDYAKLCESES